MRFEDITHERLKPRSLSLGGGEIVGIAGLKEAGGQASWKSPPG
jgi:ABC-type sugar transport system ATPase subunit